MIELDRSFRGPVAPILTDATTVEIIVNCCRRRWPSAEDALYCIEYPFGEVTHQTPHPQIARTMGLIVGILKTGAERRVTNLSIVHIHTHV